MDKSLIGIGQDMREKGRKYNDTNGSDHYKREDKIEAIDVIISEGWGEIFCKANIIKYTMRCKGPQDVRKVADYANLLAGLLLSKEEEADEHSASSDNSTN